jgi:hypothetical protein
LYDPITCWMKRYLKLQNAPAAMFNREEAVQRTERRAGTVKKSNAR